MSLNDLLPYLLGAGGVWLTWRFGKNWLLSAIGKWLLSAASRIAAQQGNAPPTPPVQPVQAMPESQLEDREREELRELLARAAKMLEVRKGEKGEKP